MKTMSRPMGGLKTILSGLLLSLQFVTVAHAATYYVDAVSGSDTNAGTSTGTAWQTLSKVTAQTFVAGDQILFKAGQTFTGQLYPKGSGSSGNPITIDKYGTGALPIIAGNTGTVADGAAVLLKSQQYWDIKNLEITNAVGRLGVKIYTSLSGTTSSIRLYNLKVHNVNGAQGSLTDRLFGGILFHHDYVGAGGKFDTILVSGCEVYDINVIGIQLFAVATASRSTNTHITNTIVHDCGQDGITWRQTAGALIEYCTAYRTGLTQLLATGGIWLKLSDNSIIQYCESYSNTDIGTDGQGFDLDIGCTNCIVQYCYSHDNDGGFVLICTDNNDNVGSIVRYNISENDGDKTFRIGGGVSGAQIYNNTIYVSAATPLNYVVSMANWNGYPANTVFKNNIICQYTSANYSFFGATGTVFDYNCFAGNHPSLEPADAHKILADPLFAAPNTGGTGLNTVSGYQLTLNSPVRNAGTAISGYTGTDYFGGTVPRGGATDLGAAEYASSDTGLPLDYTVFTLADESFDAGTVGTLPTGWTESLAGRATVVADPSGTDKGLRIQSLSTDSTTNNAIKAFSAASAGFLTVDCEFKPGQTNVSSAVEILSSAGTAVVSVAFSDLGLVAYKSNGVWTHTTMAFTANTWYGVRIVVDVANRIYSIYVNDLSTPLVFQVPIATAGATDVSSLRFSVNHGVATTSAVLNELTVVHQINPSTALLAEAFDSSTTGALPSGWTSSPAGRVTAVEDPAATNKSLQLQNLSTDGGTNSATKSFTGVSSGLVTIETKIKSAQTSVASQIDVLGTGSVQAGACSFAASGTIAYKTNGVWVNTGISYSSGIWYNLRFVLDLDNRSYSLWVDDMVTPIAFNVPFAAVSTADITSYRLLLNHGVGTATVQVDGVYAFRRVNPAATSLAQSFDAVTTGTLPSGWTSSIVGRATAVEVPTATDKSLQLQNLSTDPGSNSVARTFTAITSGFVTVECKLTTGQTNIATQVDVLGTGDLQAGTCSFAASGTIAYKSNGSWVNTGIPFTANTWYNLRFVLDLNNRTYSMYVDYLDAPLAYDVPFAATSTSDIVSYRLLLNHGAATATAKVNDVYVFH